MWTPNRQMFLRRYICEGPNIINRNHAEPMLGIILQKQIFPCIATFALLNLFCYHEKKFLIMTN